MFELSIDGLEKVVTHLMAKYYRLTRFYVNLEKNR